jgi:peptide/nickel transport system permease protein
MLTVLVILGAAVVIFTAMYFVPGDPAEILLGPGATPGEIAAKRAALGLDQPFFVQLGNFMYNAFIRFDLGTSWFRGTSVMSGVIERLPRTFLLGLLTVVLTVAGGVPIGISAAIHQGGWQDRTLIVSSMFFISVPEFWLALMLILVFSLKLGMLPSFGIENWTCYILPVVSGSMAGISSLARQTRSSVLEVVRADYITTARAKGMKEKFVIFKHMLPNALIPIITLSGGFFARCVGGTIVLEKIFSFPGIGLYMSDAISQRDYPIVRGCVIILAAFTALLMLVVDLAYGFADPQIKAQYAEFGKKKSDARGEGRRAHSGRHGHNQGETPPQGAGRGRRASRNEPRDFASRREDEEEDE